ncbi:hypothetical protein M427DRAFT_28296 [Gonapodya prolifera JEL478]|uniref:Ribosome biogenesis protein NSA1 n=1 Tax=Gonapodya prolifera (strain JEL478) TaxID=1344416 RepID=A0A139AV54_GONPJ|nr:hypothetical protein M427DRAFT_28296 [Gonapodya prolifera JEL478]|eukprot:KXS20611.1 hypothetical protein M427DRAFT_28296 [Gonapodya prolifera JEL478]
MPILFVGDEVGTVRAVEFLPPQEKEVKGDDDDTVKEDNDGDGAPPAKRRKTDGAHTGAKTKPQPAPTPEPRVVASWSPTGHSTPRFGGDIVLDKDAAVTGLDLVHLHHTTPVILSTRTSGTALLLPLPVPASASAPLSLQSYPYFPVLRAASTDPRLRDEAAARLPPDVIPLPGKGPNAHKKVRGATWAGRGRFVCAEIVDAVQFPVVGTSAVVVAGVEPAPKPAKKKRGHNAKNAASSTADATDAAKAATSPAPTPVAPTTTTLPGLITIDESGILLIHHLPPLGSPSPSSSSSAAPVPDPTSTPTPPLLPPLPLRLPLLTRIPEASYSGLHRARVSPCGTFIAAGGEELDLRVWEVGPVVRRAGEGAVAVATNADTAAASNLAPRVPPSNAQKPTDSKISTETKTATEPQPIFLAKSPPHDSFDMRIPVWITDLRWAVRGLGVVVVGTGYGEIRIYDVFSSTRRPLLTLRSDPLTPKLDHPPPVRCIAVTPADLDWDTERVAGRLVQVREANRGAAAADGDGTVGHGGEGKQRKPKDPTATLGLRVCWGDQEGEVGHVLVSVTVGLPPPAPPPTPAPSTHPTFTPTLVTRSVTSTPVQRCRPSCAGSVGGVVWVPPARQDLGEAKRGWTVAAVGADRFLRWWDVEVPIKKVGSKAGIEVGGAGKMYLKHRLTAIAASTSPVGGGSTAPSIESLFGLRVPVPVQGQRGDRDVAIKVESGADQTGGADQEDVWNGMEIVE